MDTYVYCGCFPEGNARLPASDCLRATYQMPLSALLLAVKLYSFSILLLISMLCVLFILHLRLSTMISIYRSLVGAKGKSISQCNQWRDGYL